MNVMNDSKVFMSTRRLLTILMLLNVQNAFGETISSQSGAVVNSYGATIYPITQAPAQIINPVLTDMKTGGVAHTMNARTMLELDFEPDFMDSVVGDSGKTTILCTHEHSPYGQALGDKVTMTTRISKRRAFGTLTIMAKIGKGKDVDISVMKHDVKVYLLEKFGRVVAETDITMLASNYALKTSGSSIGNAQSSGFSFISSALSGVNSNSSAGIDPILSITYLLK